MSRKPFDIIGLGVLAVDDVLYVPHYPGANSKTRLTHRAWHGGGRIGCGLAAASRLGARCAVLGRLGDNPESDFVRRELNGVLGVDLSLMLHDADAGPVHAVVVVSNDTGSRAIFADFSASNPLEPEELQPDWFTNTKLLLVDHLNPPCIVEALKLAKEAGVTTVSDIERYFPEYETKLPYIDHLVHSSDFALPYTETDCPAAACEALADRGDHESVVVTAGADGCYYRVRGDQEIYHHPAHEVDVVDTTGCGDVFHGVFCYGVTQGWPMARIIAWSTAGAAVKATRTGGWLGVPTHDEIAQMLETGTASLA